MLLQHYRNIGGLSSRLTMVVVPIFEKDSERVCSDYSGISLLSVVEKVYVQVLKRRV